MPRETESFWVEEEVDRTVLGFLVGAGLGLVIGLTSALALAPQAGEATRAELRETALRMQERISRRLRSRAEPDDWEG